MEFFRVYRENKRIADAFIWQFAACRVTEEWFSSRVRCHNKGMVDEYKRPKEAFDVVKELFRTMK